LSLPSVPKRHSGFSSRSLARTIFAAEMPEQFIRTIPAQSLFMAVKQNGLVASSDLIEIATLEQCRLMLDFDCWEGDRFCEERFWEWLSLSDDDNGLKLLQKLLRFVDLKFIGLLIARYVEVRIFEDPTENPPGNGFHTPDKGSTWLGIHTLSADKHFLLARLLALVFETNAELFYQLISIPNVSTEAVLEEESFQERTKRLSAEGVPDRAWAFKINAPLTSADFSQMLETASPKAIADIAVIEPIVYDSLALQPLTSFLDAHPDRESAEMEITLIANSAVVHWGVDFGDEGAMTALIERVKGALNIGIELAFERHPKTDSTILARKIGLQPLYRLGLGRILELKRAVKKSPQTAPPPGLDEGFVELIGAALDHPFPQAPDFLNRRGEVEVSQGDRISTATRAFEHLTEIAGIEKILLSRSDT
jgi:hypothetical protein